MSNYTGRKQPKLDHMYEEDRLGSEIAELGLRMTRQMERFLKCMDLKAGDACLDTDVRAGIFGRDWRPNRQQGLEYQKRVVTRVEKGMVCGKKHIFYVSVIQGPSKGEGREDEEKYFAATRRSENENEFDFIIPKNVVALVQIRTLCRFSTPELGLYEVDEAGREVPCELEEGEGHHFVLELNKTMALGAGYVSDDSENEVYIVKSEDGGDVVRINLHTKEWVGAKKDGVVGVDGSGVAVVVGDAGSGRYTAERAALGEIVGRLTRDTEALGAVGEGSLESDIGQLTENFEYIVSELERLLGGGGESFIEELESVGGVRYEGGRHAELRNLLRRMQCL